jgi:hypothetical protein
LAELADVAPEPELLELAELQAAMRVTAARAATAAVTAREGPTPGRLRKLMGNLLVALSGSAAGVGASGGTATRSAVCQENRSDV